MTRAQRVRKPRLGAAPQTLPVPRPQKTPLAKGNRPAPIHPTARAWPSPASKEREEHTSENDHRAGPSQPQNPVNHPKRCQGPQIPPHTSICPRRHTVSASRPSVNPRRYRSLTNAPARRRAAPHNRFPTVGAVLPAGGELGSASITIHGPPSMPDNTPRPAKSSRRLSCSAVGLSDKHLEKVRSIQSAQKRPD